MSLSSSVVVWESGRASERHGGGRQESWLVALLLVLSVAVLSVFIGILREDVRQGDQLHEMQRASVAAHAADVFDPTPVDDVEGDTRPVDAQQPVAAGDGR